MHKGRITLTLETGPVPDSGSWGPSLGHVSYELAKLIRRNIAEPPGNGDLGRFELVAIETEQT